MHFIRRMLCTPVSSSKGTDVCAKCDHFHDFEDNCALFRYCWRHFVVWRLFPLHLTRRMICKPFLASKGTEVCKKCNHLRDFEENCALFCYWWRYFSVQTLFPLHFTRRTLRTPVSSSKGADVCAKCDHFLDLEENCALFRYCSRYFGVWALIPLHFIRWMLRTFFSVETSPTVRKMRRIYSILTKTARYIGSVLDISTFNRYFHCILHAERYARRL